MIQKIDSNVEMESDAGAHHGFLLRAVAQQLNQVVLPELTSPAAKVHAGFSASIAEYLAADLDILPALLDDMRGQYRAGLNEAIAVLSQQADEHRHELDDIQPQTGLAAQRELTAYRNLASRIIRILSDVEGPQSDVAMKMAGQLGALDFAWINAFETAIAARKPANEKTSGDQVGPAGGVTAEMMTRYLRASLSNSPDVEVIDLSIVLGGRSKRTIALTVANTDELPSNLIMRQDMTLKYEGQSVKSEVDPLRYLVAKGLPVPNPLLFQPEKSEMGGPFFLMPRVAGGPPGTYFGPTEPCRDAIVSLAGILGKLHSIDRHELGLPGADVDPRELMRGRVEEYWEIWRSKTTRGSALVDYAYARARQILEEAYEGDPTLVHGDFGAYNWMTDNGKLTAVLDWEFLHIGDPAEDLGAARMFVEAEMPWAEFMDIYRAADGPEVSENRVVLAQLMQWLKGTTLVATSARNFIEGGTDDFIKGANSYVGLKQIEMKIADALKNDLA